MGVYVFEVADLGNVCKVVRAALCSCVLHSSSQSRDPPVLSSASCVHHELFEVFFILFFYKLEQTQGQTTSVSERKWLEIAQCLHVSGHAFVGRAITVVICSPDHQKLAYPFARVHECQSSVMSSVNLFQN